MLCSVALAHQPSRFTSRCCAFRAAKHFALHSRGFTESYAFRAEKHFALHGRGFTESEAKMHTPRNASQAQVPDNLDESQEKAITKVTGGKRFQELNLQNFSRDYKKEAQNCPHVYKSHNTKEM